MNHSKTSNSSIEHCYLNLPEDRVEDNPLDLENIKEKQDKDDKLTQSTVTHPTWYSHKTINDVEDILCYTKPGDNAANWRIACWGLYNCLDGYSKYLRTFTTE